MKHKERFFAEQATVISVCFNRASVKTTETRVDGLTVTRRTDYDPDRAVAELDAALEERGIRRAVLSKEDGVFTFAVARENKADACRTVRDVCRPPGLAFLSVFEAEENRLLSAIDPRRRSVARSVRRLR